MEDFQGYRTDFMGPGLNVPLPMLPSDKKADAARELTYTHFSVLLSQSRRFPFYTATNINGGLFQPIPREKVFDSGSDEWKIDSRAIAQQWGQPLYDAPHSDFQRGHMTKREDPQWGSTVAVARQAAQDTFHFSNCVPQVAELNTKVWGALERYILTTKSVKDKLLVNVFTGPALLPDDPIFVTHLIGKPLLLPKFFWKVVYYSNDGLRLDRAAFLMGQREALLAKGIAKEPTILTKLLEFKSMRRQDDYFDDYKDAKLYQVNTAFVEQLTGLKFAPAQEVFNDTRARAIVFQQVQVPVRENLLQEAAKVGLPELEYNFINLLI